MAITRDLNALVDALDEARPTLTEADQHLGLALYRALGKGEPVSDEDLTAASGIPVNEVQAGLARWPGIFRNETGQVIGFWGLSVGEMPPHEIGFEGRKLWAWCAWDTLFLPARLGAALDVTSVCPTTGASIELRVSPDGVETVSPEEVVVSFLEPDKPFDSDVITSFCHFVHFFIDAAAGEKWTAEHPGTFLLSLDEAVSIARLSNERLLGDAL